ncbi:MAG TPA: RagB/SusD family nutrient uptake outer membrane protein, partial [Chryseosolibacter sp.]|nr:RagB/SusD family nutrient uptake outer membrane protein [Chryseosolibacter sp.]
MKKFRIYISLAILAVVVTPISCNDDFLNTKPQDKISSSVTWTDGALAQAFIFHVYSFLGYGGFEEQMLAAYTDEAMFTHAGRNINTFTEGSESPSNIAWT